MLRGDDPSVRPIGGGTALMLMMKARLFEPTRLVSLARVAGLSGIALGDGGSVLKVGAATTFTALDRSDTARGAFPILAHTMRTLANIRVRNVATVGGNLAHADPHLDLPIVWTALDAEVTVAGPDGTRTLPVADISAGYYETVLAADEMITELRAPIRPGWRSTYVKVTTRAAHDWPAIGLGIALDLAEGRTVRDLRLVLGAATDRPTRLIAAEAVLRGAVLDDAALAEAGEAAAAEADMESDERGSASYKRHLLAVHLARGIRTLMEEGRA